THILNFDEDLYGENIRVDILNFERPEQKFGDIESLKKQMNFDKLKAVSFFEGYSSN
ncbi:MAG: riboflavin kinase, partial [Lachnospiraceae bacterium]|nr:riboflavin kinase [Lachnospiraceae bacterium]